jgi:hypothetical protein
LITPLIDIILLNVSGFKFNLGSFQPVSYFLSFAICTAFAQFSIRKYRDTIHILKISGQADIEMLVVSDPDTGLHQLYIVSGISAGAAQTMA